MGQEAWRRRCDARRCGVAEGAFGVVAKGRCGGREVARCEFPKFQRRTGGAKTLARRSGEVCASAMMQGRRALVARSQDRQHGGIWLGATNESRAGTIAGSEGADIGLGGKVSFVRLGAMRWARAACTGRPWQYHVNGEAQMHDAARTLLLPAGKGSSPATGTAAG
jgi:hypothetical protein